MSTPAITRALDDLKGLLREGVITLPQWRTEVAAIVQLERDMRRQPAPPPPRNTQLAHGSAGDAAAVAASDETASTVAPRDLAKALDGAASFDA